LQNKKLNVRFENTVNMEIILDTNKRYTYADYLTWIDDKRRELINGFIHLMSPAASEPHANISGNIFGELKWYIKKHKGKCRVYSAPFDVRLPANGETENDKIYSVVQGECPTGILIYVCLIHFY
jgi:Uma2 family endonuclease